MFATDTIAAISTPPGKGGVAIIRISGEAAFEIAERCFSPRSGKPLSAYPARHAVYGCILSENRPIDDGLAVRFPAPASYTGENMVEICCHGGILLTQKVLEETFAQGAVQAAPGEFTRRAFVNGKLSLSRAEAVGRLLEAQTEAQMKLAAPDATDALEGEVGGIYGLLLSLLSSLFADIDYPEEDLGELSVGEILSRLREAQTRLDALLATYRTGHAIAEGIPCVICGRPNVGKSSLYNLLCGEERAIVTSEAGTTRDVLEKTVACGQVTLLLCDTAGLRNAESAAEKIGVERSRARIKEAELIFAVFDASAPLTEEDRALLDELAARRDVCRVGILNKTDLPSVLAPSDIAPACDEVLSLSALTGDKQPLCELVEKLFLSERITPGDRAILSGARQAAAVRRAAECVQSAQAAFAAGFAHDVAASDIERALSALGEISGREVSEQIVADIFSHFCVGK